jgi:myo-inositol catabolism protein IolH
MKIALDPYMFRALPMQEMVRTVADVGYSYIELSPREEFMPFFLHPRADDQKVAELKNCCGRLASSSPVSCHSASGPARTRPNGRWPCGTGNA